MQNLKFKTFLTLIGLILGHSAFACDGNPWSAWINGPSECVPIGSVQTYVGTTDLTSSACTVHEWTVTDGVIVIADGVAQPPGTTMVCLWEDGCRERAIQEGQCATGTLQSITETTSTITVRWVGGAGEGKVFFKAREYNYAGELDLAVSTEKKINYPPAATSISRSGNACSASKTYTAVFPVTCQEPTGYSWTRNGSPAGNTFSPQINLSVPVNQGVTVGVTALYPAGRSLTFSRYFGPSSESSANIEGPNLVCKGGTTDYYLSGIIPGTVNWSVSSPASIAYQNGINVGVFLPEGTYTEGIVLIASGVNNCNVPFYVSKSIGISDLPCQVLQSGETIESRSIKPEEEEEATIVQQEIEVYPTLLTSGQSIQVNLPETDGVATPYELTILGIDGKIRQENKYMPGLVNVSTATLPSGNYILKVQSKDNSKVFRFVIVN